MAFASQDPAKLRFRLSGNVLDECRFRLDRYDNGLQSLDNLSFFDLVHQGFNSEAALLSKFQSNSHLGLPRMTLSAPMVHRARPE